MFYENISVSSCPCLSAGEDTVTITFLFRLHRQPGNGLSDRQIIDTVTDSQTDRQTDRRDTIDLIDLLNILQIAALTLFNYLK